MNCGCFIIPVNVLERFAGDRTLSEEQQRSLTLISSIHFGVKYNNAFWNGTKYSTATGTVKSS